MTNFDGLQQQLAFSQNLEACRKIIFRLRYIDVTRYTALAESTMISYDTHAVSPYITIAKKIADLYCTSIERLCDFPIYSRSTEVLFLQTSFINRLGKVDVSTFQESLFLTIDKFPSIEQGQVYKLLQEYFRDIIVNYHKQGAFAVIERDKEIVENFTRNFNDLYTNTKIGYRKLGKAIDCSIGNLTRLKKGCEPMLSMVIKLADFFGVSITQILSKNPQFDYYEIAKEIQDKKTIKNEYPTISMQDDRFERKNRYTLLSPTGAKQIIQFWLNKIAE